MICPESNAKNSWDDHHTFLRVIEKSFDGDAEFSVFICKCGKRVDYQSSTVKGRDKL